MGVSVWWLIASQASGMAAARVSRSVGGVKPVQSQRLGWKEAQSWTVKSSLAGKVLSVFFISQ
jgi:hypothetical protein